MDRETFYAALHERHTKEHQEKFDKTSVYIGGLGGLGSNVAILLARLGVGHIHLVDFDRVDISNIHRQQYYVSDIGKFKTEVMCQRLLDINPYIAVTTTNARVTRDNAAEIFENADIICEAFDEAETKAMFVNEFFENFGQRKKLVAASGMAGFLSSNTIKTKKITDNFYLCGDFETDVHEQKTLTAGRVAVCAAHQANMITRLIIGEEC